MDAKDPTVLLAASAAGSRPAADELLALVYGKLRDMAGVFMASEDASHTLQPTALVNEAFLKLIDQRTTWRTEAHFLGIAAEAMRRVLVDHARAKRAKKRGGPGRDAEPGAPRHLFCRVLLDQVEDQATAASGADLLDLDEALRKLEAFDVEASQVAIVRFFGGLGVNQTAEYLGIAPRTVEKRWAKARTFLWRELRPGDAED